MWKDTPDARKRTLAYSFPVAEKRVYAWIWDNRIMSKHIALCKSVHILQIALKAGN